MHNQFNYKGAMNKTPSTPSELMALNAHNGVMERLEEAYGETTFNQALAFLEDAVDRMTTFHLMMLADADNPAAEFHLSKDAEALRKCRDLLRSIDRMNNEEDG